MSESTASEPHLQAARDAGLRYVTDDAPGIRRVARGSNFDYQGPDGKRVKDQEALKRIKGLVIPPAWKNVWIAVQPGAHLQATGRDARGRKQYRYHAKFRATRDATKFERMFEFGRKLPVIRRHVRRDLALAGMPREKVVAAVVRLLERTLIRIGNDEYARTNKSYGLTTLRNRHASVTGSKVRFEFRGKSGIQHVVDINDPVVARLVRRCQELPGQQLFTYADAEGNAAHLGSDEVNAYLRSVTEEDFTAKDFRTWAGTVLVTTTLRDFEPFESITEAKRNIVLAIATVARRLGNTASVCRKCYIHPAVIDAYLARQLPVENSGQRPNLLRAGESAVLKLLRKPRARPRRARAGSSAPTDVP